MKGNLRMKSKSYMNFNTLIIIPAAIVAYLAGSATATGREALQFYASHGYQGIIGLCMSLVLFIWASISILKLGYDKKDENESVFTYYFGKYLGPLFEWFVILMLYGVVTTMLSGVGAVFVETYNINKFVGMTLMGSAVFLTVILNLKKLLNILGSIGSVIIILMVLVSVITLATNYQGIANAGQILSSMEISGASSYGWLSGILYAAFCMSVIAAFMMRMGSTLKSSKEGLVGGATGSLLYVGMTAVVFLALLTNIQLVAGVETPLIALANEIHPTFAIIYSIVILAGIFSTAAPMLWTVCDKIILIRPEWNIKIVSASLTIFAIVGGSLFPFSQMVDTLYPFMGYVGILLFIAIAFKQIRNLFKKKTKVNIEVQTQAKRI